MIKFAKCLLSTSSITVFPLCDTTRTTLPIQTISDAHFLLLILKSDNIFKLFLH